MERNKWKCDYCRLTKEQVIKRDQITEEEFEIEKVDRSNLTSFCKFSHAVKWINKNVRFLQQKQLESTYLSLFK